MHGRQLYCIAESFTAESFTAWQKALMHNGQLQMHSRKLHCTAGSFIAQQKVLLHSRKVSLAAKLEKSSFCSRNWRKFPSTTKTKDKPTLQRLPLDLDSTFAHNLATAKWYFGALSAER